METENLKTATEPPMAGHPDGEENPWENVSGLPCLMSVALPVRGFKVRDLLELEIETVLDTGHSTSSAVPVWVNSVRIGEAEFDVFGTRLAIRVDELG